MVTQTAMPLAEYAGYDATALAALVRRGDVHPAELLETAIAAAEAVDPKLNAITVEAYDYARKAIADGLPDGPFRGVPFLLKDLTAHAKGMVTTSGWVPRRDAVMDYDTELVARYKRSGVAIFGRTAVPELAMDWSTESRLHGPTHNPWNLAHSTGTSSGGTAAAIAAGIVPMAHGNDGGGSIRVPASACGVFGLKPSRHRNPSGPIAGDVWQGMICEHVLTRTVRDSALMLDATSGIDVGAFHNAPPKARPFVEEVGAEPKKLRIALSTTAPYGAPTHPDCVAAAEDAAALCEALGHTIERAELPLPPNGWDAMRTFVTVEYAHDMLAEERRMGRPLAEDDFAPVMWQMIQDGRSTLGIDVARAQSVLHKIARDFGRFFQTYDAFLSPTLAVPPVKLGHFRLDVTPDEHWRAYLAFMPYTHVFNIGGQPAMSVPLSWNAAGLPIGVQFAAPVGDEATLFRLASQLEAARPWKGRVPPVSVAHVGV